MFMQLLWCKIELVQREDLWASTGILTTVQMHIEPVPCRKDDKTGLYPFTKAGK